MEKTSQHRKKQFVPNAFKFFIAVGSLAGTLGIWNLLANKDMQQANAQNNIGNQTVSNIDQVPLPTLVPLVTVNVNTSGVTTVSQPAAALPLREVTQPPTTTGSSTSVNAAKNSNPVVIPAPVTRTRSSKP
jgi:hypothetical protein